VGGERVDDPAALERIRALAVPPAWTDVWICPDPHGHLQAVGTDAAGRRQYRYHERWRARRDHEKFEQMLLFARALPGLRAVAAKQLKSKGPELELACAVRLLDLGFFRVGGEEYVEENGSYGLATLERRHVEVAAGGVLVFDYPAKSGRRRVQMIVDPEVYEVVVALKRRRHPTLLDVRSSEINAYIKEHAGEEFSAKDFRTWNATVLAAVALAVSDRATTKTGRKRAVTRAIAEVAHYLGNTPAVCRASYIDPRVFDRYRAGVTISHEVESLPQDAIEDAVLSLLGDESRPRARRRAAASGGVRRDLRPARSHSRSSARPRQRG
jgi:DNA topoisomerase-1